jgi:hypothetical protein
MVKYCVVYVSLRDALDTRAFATRRDAPLADVRTHARRCPGDPPDAGVGVGVGVDVGVDVGYFRAPTRRVAGARAASRTTRMGMMTTVRAVEKTWWRRAGVMMMMMMMMTRPIQSRWMQRT